MFDDDRNMFHVDNTSDGDTCSAGQSSSDDIHPKIVASFFY